MAQNLAVEHCELHPDVLKSLLDVDFGTQSKPYKSLAVPGIVNAVDYDFGTNGIAYGDTDYKNVGGAGGTAYNHGNTYRNDGVDIERCQDPSGPPYDVGWIESGEGMNYSVNIGRGGEYRVNLRVASSSATGRLRLFIDDQPVTGNVIVPSTGSSQLWTTLSMDNVQLPAGQHLLTALFPTGGFNFSRMEFIPTSTDGGGESANIGLMQISRNVFSTTTEISYVLDATRFVTLKIYDALGQEVSILEDGLKSQGSYRVTWDSANRSSGVYFCRLQVGNIFETKKILLVK
jgi:hypothetical protein